MRNIVGDIGQRLDRNVEAERRCAVGSDDGCVQGPSRPTGDTHTLRSGWGELQVEWQARSAPGNDGSRDQLLQQSTNGRGGHDERRH